MNGDELKAARRTLGEMWGFGRPLHASELGRALAVEMMLAGARPTITQDEN